MKIEIIPAILPKDFSELEEKIGLVQDYVKTVQIDVCDGQFTPQASWPYKKHDDSFEKIQKEENGLPGWKTLNFEIDLMANKPEEKVDGWVRAGATRIILHVESRGDVGQAIKILKDRAEIGLALNIDTPISEIGNPKFAIDEGSIQFIQLMGIDRIGFQGQAFDSKVIEKIKEIKKMYPQFSVSVDGGVSLENAVQLIDAGADRLVVGSAIFESDNYLDTIRKFKMI
ncbi:MAG: hypothetical protein AAB470_00065 [Patescibacteria group bacterium]